MNRIQDNTEVEDYVIQILQLEDERQHYTMQEWSRRTMVTKLAERQ